MELLAYSQLFTRVVLLLLFVIAFIGKIRDVHGFERTISNFEVIPHKLIPASARLFLCGEMGVILLLGWGDNTLLPGFILAFFLLLIFSGALLSILIRRLRTSCNCFGSSQTPVSAYDIWRNGGFLLCALVGSAASISSSDKQAHISPSVLVFVGLLAVVFALLWMNLRAVISLFERS
jgi:hypothetical protein